MNQVTSIADAHKSSFTAPITTSDLMAALPASGQAIARLERANNLLELLIAHGVVFSIKEARVRFRSPRFLDPGHKADLAALRTEVLFLIERSDAMPVCTRCTGRLIEQFTFDGFANILCPACEWSLGCIPVSPRAIERFGYRGVESLPAFVKKEAAAP